ncbi:MAG: redox-sensing transcriptional repressor Rex [Spirochaetaceae bacterium]|jgi:redox-sensing transcriptional repressor|nr:redox-sensing transcriptional repressor Rex [Spirochaetaceae bacterium]
MAKEKIMAAPSVRRLPGYLNIIRALKEDGEQYISSTFIARELNIEPVQVRKDLAITGVFGRPQKGYPIESLISAIERFLGWDAMRGAVLAGVGNLGSALLGHREFNMNGLKISAAFDSDARKIGTVLHGIKIMDAQNIANEISRLGIKIAVLTVPRERAIEAAGVLVKAGIHGIWNFTGEKLPVPGHVTVQNEELSSGFAMLCIKLRNKSVCPE